MKLILMMQTVNWLNKTKKWNFVADLKESYDDYITFEYVT